MQNCRASVEIVHEMAQDWRTQRAFMWEQIFQVEQKKAKGRKLSIEIKKGRLWSYLVNKHHLGFIEEKEGNFKLSSTDSIDLTNLHCWDFFRYRIKKFQLSFGKYTKNKNEVSTFTI